MTDGGLYCETLGCENAPDPDSVYCEECLVVSPGLSDDEEVADWIRDAASRGWDDADFANPEADVYPPELLEREQWMGAAGKSGKQPFAPWGVRDHPDADPDEDARWKWGITDNYANGETVALAKNDPRIEGRTFIQLEEDPYAFVDGDDVRCPETGEIHPAFIALLEHLGLTYGDVSTSGSGAHAYYRGELPIDKGQAAFEIDTEPWGANDDLPVVEIYANKHVNVATGKHVPGTPLDVNGWNKDALVAILKANGYRDTPKSGIDHDTDRDRPDLDDYDPDATTADETTHDVRDILAAVDQLTPRDLPLSSSRTGTDSTGWETWDPSYRRSESSESVHRPPGESVFYDHREGESFGLLGLFAGEQGIISRPWDRLAGEEWWTAVELAREKSASIPEYTPSDDSEPVAVLPNSPKARAVAQGAGWAAADTNTGDVLTQQDVYDRTKDTIEDAMRCRGQVAIDAIMGGGKTYSSFLAAFEREEPLAYFAPRGELYDQGVQYALDVGYDRDEIHVLPSGPRDCPTFQGEHGEAATDRVWTLYDLGVTPKAIHNLLGDDLPCCDGEGADGKCDYELLLEFDPDDYEVIIGHYKHAHLPHVTGGRHIVVDENPADAFMTRIEGEQLIQGVNAFLSLHNSPPFESFTDLLEHRHTDDERRKQAVGWFSTFDFEPDEQNAVRFETEGFHAYAPHAVYAILTGSPTNGEEGYPFEKATLEGIGDEARFFATSEQCGEYYVELQTPPELEYTRSVIALDGTPYVDPETADGPPEGKCATEWENALGQPLAYRQVLTDDERAEFLTETQGNVYIQTSPYVKPYSSGKWNNKEADAAKLRAIAEQYGDGDAPLVFTEKKVRDEYEPEFVENGLAAGFDHSGNLRGSDEYASERFAVQLGSSHHGDHELRRRAAWLEATVDPDGKGAERDYGDVGNGVLWQMREAQVAQNALRVGRDGRGALVCLDTAAYPDWLPVKNDDAPGDVSLWGSTERAVREVVVSIHDADGKHRMTAGLTTAEIAEHVDDVTERTIRRACRRHADRGLLAKRSDKEDGRRVRWVDIGLGELDTAACATVDLPDIGEFEDGDGNGEVADKPRLSIYMRNVRNSNPDVSHPAARDVPPANPLPAGADPPPDDRA